METLTLEINNPKVKDILKDLEALDLLHIVNTDEYADEFKLILDKEYDDYQNGIGESYSRGDLEKILSKK